MGEKVFHMGFFLKKPMFYAVIAQLVERLLPKQEVAESCSVYCS